MRSQSDDKQRVEAEISYVKSGNNPGTRTPLRLSRWKRKDGRKTHKTSALRAMIQNHRKSMVASETHKEMWEAKYRTEKAVRRKHGLGEDVHFEANFWNQPMSAHLSLRYRQQKKEDERMAARRARGNTTLPKPPRSSLSNSEQSDEIEIDHTQLEMLWKMEELEMQERQARKIAEEVGYLYFVGEMDGLREWRAEYLTSDRQLVYRKENPMNSGRAMSISDISEVSDSDDAETHGEEEACEHVEANDEMEVDG
ncbi:hypothetical protein ACEQ8H_002201 [Pleosporales sp. CAS-2024a]